MSIIPRYHFTSLYKLQKCSAGMLGDSGGWGVGGMGGGGGVGGAGGCGGGGGEVLGFLKGPLFRRSCTRNALQQGQIAYNRGLGCRAFGSGKDGSSTVVPSGLT